MLRKAQTPSMLPKTAGWAKLKREHALPITAFVSFTQSSILFVLHCQHLLAYCIVSISISWLGDRIGVLSLKLCPPYRSPDIYYLTKQTKKGWFFCSCSFVLPLNVRKLRNISYSVYILSFSLKQPYPYSLLLIEFPLP